MLEQGAFSAVPAVNNEYWYVLFLFFVMGCVPALLVQKKTLHVMQEVTISIVTLLCFLPFLTFFFGCMTLTVWVHGGLLVVL